VAYVSVVFHMARKAGSPAPTATPTSAPTVQPTAQPTSKAQGASYA
jgi:hypothetical protein